jgi:hypothetical protein
MYANVCFFCNANVRFQMMRTFALNYRQKVFTCLVQRNRSCSMKFIVLRLRTPAKPRRM